ncbi:MAG: hypothetical protein H7Y09_13845, partial [Chitinophagaceae bacterium]|nr:hypothetical protein [Anaerolineae bacterium]
MSNARIVRVYNVLRQYDERDVSPALDTMAHSLEVGGLLIEGTSNPTGRMVVFDVYRKAENETLTHQALVFGTNFKQHLMPIDFQAILPKRLIHHAHDQTPAAFFDSWQRGLSLASSAGKIGLRQQWIFAAHQLHKHSGYSIDLRKRILYRGYLVLHSPLYP